MVVNSNSLTSFLDRLKRDFSILNAYKPKESPPALTAGLSVFLILIYLASFVTSINDAITLSPKSLTSLNLNAISLYPLGHLSFFHLLFNLLALYQVLKTFEKVNGTVRTGIVLNVLAVATALPYCIIGLIFYPNGAVLGASAWVFSFYGYYAYKLSLTEPSIQLSPTFSLPTRFAPIVVLIIVTILVPGSSFIGHFLGLIVGYAWALGYLDKLIEPSSKVVEFIESKIEFVIALIPSQFKYYKEVQARETRFQPFSNPFVSRDVLPTTNTHRPTNSNSLASIAMGGSRTNNNNSANANPFVGPGHALNT